MRGRGITIARMLASPPARRWERRARAIAVCALREVLQASSPLAEIADQLEAPLAADDGSQRIEDAERRRGALVVSPRQPPSQADYAGDAEGDPAGRAAPAVPLSYGNFAACFGLDVALHALKRMGGNRHPHSRALSASQLRWTAAGGEPRKQRSEAAFASARIRLREAILAQLASEIRRLEQEGSRLARGVRLPARAVRSRSRSSIEASWRR